MTLLKWIIGAPLAIAAIAFAIANNDLVLFTWSPLNEPLEWPLYALVLAALVLGFFIGSLMTWAAGHSVRKDRRRHAKTIKKLEGEIDMLNEKQMQADTVQVTRRNLDEKDLY